MPQKTFSLILIHGKLKYIARFIWKKNVKTLISRKKVVRAKFCNFHTVQWFEDVLIWRKIHTVWKIKTFALTWIFFVKSTCEIDFMEFLKKIVRVKFHNIYSVYLTEWKCKTFSATQILREIFPNISHFMLFRGFGFQLNWFHVKIEWQKILWICNVYFQSQNVKISGYFNHTDLTWNQIWRL